MHPVERTLARIPSLAHSSARCSPSARTAGLEEIEAGDGLQSVPSDGPVLGVTLDRAFVESRTARAETYEASASGEPDLRRVPGPEPAGRPR